MQYYIGNMIEVFAVKRRSGIQFTIDVIRVDRAINWDFSTQVLDSFLYHVIVLGF